MDETIHYSWIDSIQSFLLLFLIFGIMPSAYAGEYHSLSNGTLYCEECHEFTFPRGDSVQNAGMDLPSPGERSPLPSLLKEKGNEVCLSCHDNNPNYLDVVGMNTGRAPGILREAGALNVVGGGFPYQEANGHTLNLEFPAPGSRPTWIPDAEGLKCIDCHDPHGYNPLGNPYRNLAANPGNVIDQGLIVTYSVGTNHPSSDVFLRNPKGYDAANVDFNEPVSGSSAIADYCQGCHSDFHGEKGGIEVGGAMSTGWVRHPSSAADIGWVGGRHSNKGVFSGEWTNKRNYVKVMTNTGNWRPKTAQEVSDHSPTCLSCHKAHGNMNPFGLIFMGNDGIVTEEGTSGGKYLDLCRQCHLQSISNPAFAQR